MNLCRGSIQDYTQKKETQNNLILYSHITMLKIKVDKISV